MHTLVTSYEQMKDIGNRIPGAGGLVAKPYFVRWKFYEYSKCYNNTAALKCASFALRKQIYRKLAWKPKVSFPLGDRDEDHYRKELLFTMNCICLRQSTG